MLFIDAFIGGLWERGSNNDLKKLVIVPNIWKLFIAALISYTCVWSSATLILKLCFLKKNFWGGGRGFIARAFLGKEGKDLLDFWEE